MAAMVGTFEMLKLRALRGLTGVLLKLLWRGKRAQHLGIAMHRIAVDGGDIAVRAYTPQGEGPFPVIVFMHGGGFVACDIDTHDGLCRDLCVQSGRIVVSVDYRLAPEFPFPFAVMDSFAALEWVARNGALLNADVSRLALCGDSAGGNLAAVLAILARDKHPGLVKGQVLVYPCTDHYSANYPSYETYGKGYELTSDGVRWLISLYTRASKLLKPGEIHHDLLTPLRVKNLRGLPPALVITVEFDVLRDEGLAYAGKLAAEGNDVQHRRYEGLQHGFLGRAPTPGHQQAIRDIAAWLRLKGV